MDATASQTGRKSQFVQFYMGTVQDPEASQAEGRPIYKDTPFVRIMVAGDKDNIIDQPVWDDPMHQNSHTSRFPEEWAAFKRGVSAEEQSGGTPLKLVPGITQAQVRELAHFNCYTVEQLADMPDANSGRFAGVRKLQQEARAYIERAKGAAPEKALRAELEKRDNEIETLKRQVAELAAQAKAAKK